MQPNMMKAEAGGLKETQIIVLVIKDSEYLNNMLNLTKDISQVSKRICYVTLNRPYMSIVELFLKSNIDLSKFYFVDAITKTAEMVETKDNCEFVSSPGALTELSLTISNILEKEKFDYLIFDSLSTLLVYESDTVITKFIHFLIAKIRVIGCNAFFTCLKQDNSSLLIRDINMFADKIIDVEKLSMYPTSSSASSQPQFAFQKS